ncbi:MAG: hypothetical protein NT028_09940, partial [candidate division Zixibacteria bacterium]|nr:hypothetical protein [candidate division Zixibacteria bacterium]
MEKKSAETQVPTESQIELYITQWIIDIYDMWLLDSKLSSPQAAPHHIVRPRLIDRFFGGNRANLFLLVAPAGFGKTTLALQALSRVPVSQRAWYHLDQHDAESKRFLTYLIEALLRVMPSVRNSGLKNTATSMPVMELTEELCYLIEQSKGP